MNTSEMENPITPLIPREGWHVMHLFYRVDHSRWAFNDESARREAKGRLLSIVEEARNLPDTQLLSFAVATPKADLGFMLLTPDLQVACALEKRLTLALGPDLLIPVYSYLSQTERSEYLTTTEQYIEETLKAERGLQPDSPEFVAGLAEFQERIKHYLSHRLYPKLPNWPAICFYPMSKRRDGADNWYALSFEERRKLMAGHAKTGRTYSGRILQLITASTGLDTHEWGVTLLAKDTLDIKSIVYEMRYDEVSTRYGEFGDFFIGMQLPIDSLFDRLSL